ncbi:PLP-dependent aminotransferase family protein [Pseudomonas eucalypticola]|uniref:PLP-dependent aminotransferase family protein n=1 Tax=Pseudomonas eucalypticola TaxID=2599595 RepID=A0A7D5H547_9PSED|nr:PLP-dependent aminotransferase family protein [Pseudomonas eucalypticola]QKZ04269.1 PLP-dependent aminotransferase family protein [Pseudomonas eucalypticola]
MTSQEAWQAARYRQLAERIKVSIDSGALQPGTRLPSVRTLAAQYGVSQTTALNALRTLENQRYAEARPKSGFFVAQASAARHDQAKVIAPLDEQTELHLALVGSECRVRLDLANGSSDLYPLEKMAVLLRKASQAKPAVLGTAVKGTGYPPLKAEIVRRALHHGCNLDPDALLITNGCIEALSLALRATLSAGDAVAVESPCYFVLLHMLQSLGLRVVEVPAGAAGYVDVDRLLALFENRAVNAFVTLANINNPLGKSIPSPAKAVIAASADAHGIVIIEDDIFGDTAFGEQRPFPFLAFSPNALLCSGFSKTLAPGLRIGWVYSRQHSRRLMMLKYTSSMGTSIPPQRAIAEMLCNGGYDAHLRRLRSTLATQIRQLREAVVYSFPVGTQVSEPEGGYVLWVQMPPGALNVRELFIKARTRGIGIAPGHIFATDGRYDHCFRLNAGFGWDQDVAAAIEQLATWCGESLAVDNRALSPNRMLSLGKPATPL